MQFEQSEITTIKCQLLSLNVPTIRKFYVVISQAGKSGQGDADRLPVTLGMMRSELLSRVVGPKGKLP